MSFAGPNDRLLSALLETAAERGAILVAAGNKDAPTRRFPASAAGVHAADTAPALWFARPERLSTRAGGSYQVFYGASIASAGMSGLAALLRSQVSAGDANNLLDWLFGSNCAAGPPPASESPFLPEQLCD